MVYRPANLSTSDTALQVADALCAIGWATLDNVFDAPLIESLRKELLDHAAAHALVPARVGRGRKRKRREDIRGDLTLWLDGTSIAQRTLFERIETLRLTLNRTLFLGLEDFEAHYALYPPNTHYERHFDSFQGDNLRRVSLVIYLNPSWQRRDGGLLRLYSEQGALIEEIEPRAGRIACFLSETFPHEVTPTRRPRASIAAWFRIRPSTPL